MYLWYPVGHDSWWMYDVRRSIVAGDTEVGVIIADSIIIGDRPIKDREIVINETMGIIIKAVIYWKENA